MRNYLRYYRCSTCKKIISVINFLKLNRRTRKIAFVINFTHLPGPEGVTLVLPSEQ